MLNRVINLTEPDPKRMADALRADLEALENDLRGISSGSKLGAQAGAAARAAARAANRMARNVGAWECSRFEAIGRQIRQRPLLICVASLVVGALVIAAFRRS